MLRIYNFITLGKRILSILIAIILTVSLAELGIIASSSKVTELTGTSEEKILSKATINDDFADDRVLVVFSNESSLSFKTYIPSDFEEINCKKIVDLSVSESKIVKQSVQRMNCAEKSNLTNKEKAYDNSKISNYNQIVCIYLNEIGKDKVIEAINTIRKRSDVMYVGPDYKIYSCSSNSVVSPNDRVYADGQEPVFDIISLPQAWTLVQNIDKQTVRIGVLDTGIKESKSDLDAVVNTSLSRDFTTGSCVPVDIVQDPVGHGTQMSSIIGAETNNHEGIAGVCWTADLISLRVLNEYEEGFASYLIAAIDYAMQKNIQLLSFSGRLKEGVINSNGMPAIDETSKIALEQKIENFDGLFVCSAGNDGFSNDTNNVYPANFSLNNMLTVGASDNNDRIWTVDSTGEGSNYSATKVDLCAPGVSICSINITEQIWQSTGTSPSAAMVTGVAAIMLSVNPNLSGAELKHIIMNGVDEIDTLEDKCVNGGRLNAYNAVLGALNHNVIITSRNNYTHTGYCNDCEFSGTVEHKWEMTSASGGTYTVTCEVCQQTVSCNEEPEYLTVDEVYHTVDCPGGCYSFFEEHNSFEYTSTLNLYYHNTTCVDCGYTYQEDHVWVAYGTQYRCFLCYKIITQIPSIQQNQPPEEGGDKVMENVSGELETLTEITLPVSGEDVEIDLPPVKDEELTE